MNRLTDFGGFAAEALGKRFPTRELPAGAYAQMRYPRFPALMRFAVRRYAAEGFGHLMTMRTRAMGMMELTTVSFMPDAGSRVPYLLVDMMSMGKKRTVFVEFYDCTAGGMDAGTLDAVAARYAALPDYAEKPAWYVAERMPCSLIKGGAAADEPALFEMACAAAEAYLALAAQAPAEAENLAGLAAFRERMIREGNPSSATMARVLGPQGAARFFRTAVMPLPAMDGETEAWETKTTERQIRRIMR